MDSTTTFMDLPTDILSNIVAKTGDVRTALNVALVNLAMMEIVDKEMAGIVSSQDLDTYIDLLTNAIKKASNPDQNGDMRRNIDVLTFIYSSCAPQWKARATAFVLRPAVENGWISVLKIVPIDTKLLMTRKLTEKVTSRQVLDLLRSMPNVVFESAGQVFVASMRLPLR